MIDKKNSKIVTYIGFVLRNTLVIDTTTNCLVLQTRLLFEKDPPGMLESSQIIGPQEDSESKSRLILQKNNNL